MNNPLIPQFPIFIPRPLDSDIAGLGIQYPAILMDSHIVAWRPSVAKNMQATSKLFIVDPVTHFMLYKGAREGKSFKRLPYPKKFEVEKLYSDPVFRTQKLVKPCIDNQLKQGAGIVITPYLFAEDADDTKFGLNISMIAESIRYMRDNEINKPLFAMIHIGNSVLTRPTVINYIVDRYSEGQGFESNIRGYFIVINELDCRKIDKESLLGLANLVFKFSRNKYIFVKYMGAFGEILSAIGAYGFISGLGVGETSSVKNLQRLPKGFGRTSDWIYVPELFDYVKDDEVRRIGYKCSCKACNGSIARDSSSKKRHFLYRRMETMVALSKLNRAERIEFMKGRLESSIKLANNYINKYSSPFKRSHLKNWRDVLVSAKSWRHEEKDDGLDKLLADLDSKTK